MRNFLPGGQDAGEALRQRDFRRLWLSSFCSNCAYWALLIGLNWLVLRLSGSDTWVGVVVFANRLPFFVATPFGGLFADRMDRRKLAVAAQCLTLTAAVVLAVLTFAGVIQPWQIALLAFFGGCARSIETPATSSITPNLVRREALLSAISLVSVSTFGSRLFGPAAGGAVQHFYGAGTVFLFAGALWVFAMVFMLSVNAPTDYLARAAGAPTGVISEIRQTIEYIAETPMITLIFLVVSLHCVFTMATDAVIPFLVSHTLHASVGAYSLLVMGFGAGSLVGTLSLAGLGSREGKGRLLLVTGIASGLSTAFLGISTSFGEAFLASLLMGATQSMFMAISTTLLQEVLPDGLRGRVSSAYMMITGGLMSVGSLATGYLADRIGVVPVLAVPGLLFVVVFMVISAMRPNLRTIYRRGSLEPAASAA